jgi:type IV secretory pathway TrbL component
MNHHPPQEHSMTFTRNFRLACMAACLALAFNAKAELFTSLASSAGSASSGSASASLRGSSKSSFDGDKVAEGDYRITEVAQATDRAGFTRVAMQSDDTQQRIVLELPQATFAKERLGPGDLVHAQPRAYGTAFARSDNRQAFYLVLADDLYGELAARPVSL